MSKLKLQIISKIEVVKKQLLGNNSIYNNQWILGYNVIRTDFEFELKVFKN